MESTSLTLSQALLNGFLNLFEALIRYLPQFIVGCLIFALGLVVGNWLKSLIVKSLHSLNLGQYFQGTTFGQLFQAGTWPFKLELVLGELVRWLIIYLFSLSALNAFGLEDIADLLKGLLLYVPSLLSALIIFGLGILAAGFVESLTKNLLAPLDLATARLAGKISSYAVVIIALIIAIGELGIAKEYILILFGGFVAMIALALGLALGLGAKDLVASTLVDWSKRVKQETLKAKKAKV